MIRTVEDGDRVYTYDGKVMLSYVDNSNGVIYKCSGKQAPFTCTPVPPKEWPRTGGFPDDPVTMIVDDTDPKNIKVYSENGI